MAGVLLPTLCTRPSVMTISSGHGNMVVHVLWMRAAQRSPVTSMKPQKMNVSRARNLTLRLSSLTTFQPHQPTQGHAWAAGAPLCPH